MNRIDRLSALLIQLQTKSRITMEELEDRFEVSRRTLFRDIRSLLESGVPIGGDANEGYFIAEGYHLPPVTFNKEEAAALLLASKIMENHTDRNTDDKIRDAMDKVRAVLRFADREFLETLDNKVEIVQPFRRAGNSKDEMFLNEIQQGLVSNKVIDVTYHSNYNDQQSTRQVEPMALVHYSNHWHLIGYCRLRQDMRDFRTDRIARLSLISETFEPRKHKTYTSFTERMIGGTDAKRATIYFTAETARFVQDQRYNYGYIEEAKVDGGVEMKFVTPHYAFLGYWLMSFVDQVKIIDPPELQEIMEGLVERAYLHHKKIPFSQKPVT